jgi:hypothetical protein
VAVEAGDLGADFLALVVPMIVNGDPNNFGVRANSDLRQRLWALNPQLVSC